MPNPYVDNTVDFDINSLQDWEVEADSYNHADKNPVFFELSKNTRIFTSAWMG